jgi:integrase
MAARDAALNGEPLPIGASRVVSGTMADLIAKYCASPAWRALNPSSQRSYRRIVEKLRERHGSKPINTIQPKNIRKIAASIEAPSSQKLFVIVMKILMRYAISCGMLDANPARDVETPKLKSKPHHSWTEDEIAQYEERYPVGSRERLALALMLYTGQRLSDAILMGPQHIKNGFMHIVQVKTGAELDIPVLPQLEEIIRASSNISHLVFLISRYGRPFTDRGFGTFFRKACRGAGLPDRCRAHGLRKAAARRLAEASCSPHEIAAITGHESLREIERYTRAADRKRLAESGTAKVIVAYPRFKHEE